MAALSTFAVFLIAPSGGGWICGTTRPGGAVGLPGGKIDPGETSRQALRRECLEEGWAIPARAALALVHTDLVEGRVVEWYALAAGDLPERSGGGHKESGRGILPVPVDPETLAGFRNPEAIHAWRRWLRGASAPLFAGWCA